MRDVKKSNPVIEKQVKDGRAPSGKPFDPDSPTITILVNGVQTTIGRPPSRGRPPK